MKKLICLILTACVMLIISGCGKKSEIVNSELAFKLNSEFTFSEPLTELDDYAAEQRYGLNPGDYTELTAFAGTKGVCDEFLIIKTSAPETMASSLGEYLKTKKTDYEIYRPTETAKLDNAVIELYKDTVVMIVTADTEGARAVYAEYLKK